MIFFLGVFVSVVISKIDGVQVLNMGPTKPVHLLVHERRNRWACPFPFFSGWTGVEQKMYLLLVVFNYYFIAGLCRAAVGDIQQAPASLPYYC